MADFYAEKHRLLLQQHSQVRGHGASARYGGYLAGKKATDGGRLFVTSLDALARLMLDGERGSKFVLAQLTLATNEAHPIAIYTFFLSQLVACHHRTRLHQLGLFLQMIGIMGGRPVDRDPLRIKKGPRLSFFSWFRDCPENTA